MAFDSAQWSAVDEYLAGSLLPNDPVLDAALQAGVVAGLPQIQVSPCQGRFLQLLAAAQGARRILEIGTLGGYSTIWLGRALPPDGRLVTLELDPNHARIARESIARAGLTEKVQLRVGPALDILPKLAAEGEIPFDFFFIDADKACTADYFEWALKLSRRDSLIVVDNVIRKGAVTDVNSADPAVVGMRRFIKMAGAHPAVSATAIQTVGSKGYDGFVLARVNAEMT